MVCQVVLQVATEIRRREIHFDALLWIFLLNKLKRWHKVAVGTDENDTVGGIEYTVGYLNPVIVSPLRLIAFWAQ